MKQLVEVSGEGMESLLGEVVTLFCANYFYVGKLIGVNEDCVKISQPSIIYETGKWSDAKWLNSQSMECDSLYIQKNAVEAFGVVK